MSEPSGRTLQRKAAGGATQGAGPWTVLGIETSCDETAVAVVRGRPPGPGTILSNRVASQIEAHAPYGGVVPEIAARAHVERIGGLIADALDEADVRPDGLDAVAATAGPGLIGGVMVGLSAGKGAALGAGCPFLPVNHLEAHALTARLTDGITFPFLLLLVSGGHTQFVGVEGLGAMTVLGTTIDDALGEAFDKTAKLLGLAYPGGPEIEARAGAGDTSRFALPRPLMGRPGCDFSFSGLKTAVRQAVEAAGPIDSRLQADMAAAFQAAAADILADRLVHALDLWPAPALVVAGGVAANQALRARLAATAAARCVKLIAPPPRLCTDNAAMVAWAGLERLAAGGASDLAAPPRARWPLGTP